ncbi:MAG: ABC transporter permease subunit [Anaerolineaceae bacterium]|nr:ABC transporter permease subunit [Anaerolineaceae bacterium]
MRQILAVTKKEIRGYFGSLLAMIFLGTFIIAILFTFFSIELFFGRGIADVRPMFQWMPIILIFLIAALTMRLWSEEQHSGTIEVLLTLPTNGFKLVIGKFLAVILMTSLALLMTLPLPIMVSLLGNLDWGPVFGGYLASLLMASAYAAIGLFVSSRSDNQIVSLIVTVLLGGLFYLIGTDSFTGLFGGSVVEILRAIGTGSRFESIERGVIDLRDLVYYLSLCAIFLTLNIISIDSQRWSKAQKNYRNNQLRTMSLIMVNLVLINIWLYPLQGLRLDMTAQKEFTISQTTKDLVSNLQEPLTLRAYISEKTHPLLSPLAPQINDMLREYEIASGGQIETEIIDPIQDVEAETEANQSYGIQPTPFQIAGRNESSIVNAYFDILVRYGDQSVVLGLQDLIETSNSTSGINVQLKNLEYSLTSAIKKVVYGFQSIDSILSAMQEPVNLTLFISQSLLPENEIEIANMVIQAANNIQDQSNSKLVFSIIDPDTQDALISRQQLIETYGIEPYPLALFSNDSYFFHLLLENGDQNQIIYPPTTANEAEVRTSIESALKRTASGFLKVVGFWVPPSEVTQDMFGNYSQPLSTYNIIQQQLGENYELQSIDLSKGYIPDNIDVFLLVAPENLTEIEQFAVDQYLMRGGSVIVALSNYKLELDQINGYLALSPINNGINPLLENYGVSISSELVMDGQNAPFPVLVNRNVGNSQVQEIQAIQYPYFVDVRQDGMDDENMIVSDLATVSMNWASPVTIDPDKNKDRKSTVLLSSSAGSWLTTNTSIQPDYGIYPETGFESGTNYSSYPLAILVEGKFGSFFTDKIIPSISTTNEDGTTTTNAAASSVIEQSSENARLIVFGSAAFIDDVPLQLSANLTQDYYLNNLLLMQNAVDWSVEDTDLLMIRSRGRATRVLASLTDDQKTGWEIGTYIFCGLILISIYSLWQYQKRKIQPLSISHTQEKVVKREVDHE